MHIPPRPNIPIPPLFQQPNAFMPQYYNFQPAIPSINSNRPNFSNSGNDPKNAPMYKPNTRAHPKQGPAKSDVVHGKQNQTYQGKNNPANHPNKSMKKQQPQENKPKTVGSKTGPKQGDLLIIKTGPHETNFCLHRELCINVCSYLPIV